MKEMWNQRYSEEGFAYGREPNDFLAENWKLIPKRGKVLCIAEGEGRNAIFLIGKGFNVTACDLSEVGLEKLLNWAREESLPITTVQADLANYPQGEHQWDAVVSIWAHVPSDIRKDLHQRLVKGLKPGGILILEAYRPAQLNHKTGGPGSEDQMMTLAGLREELSGLTLEYAEEKERFIHEGKYHKGMSAVVQVIGRKKS